MNTLLYQRYYRRKLPHIQPPGATFFLTFRLDGSLPAHVWAEMRERLKTLYDEMAVAAEADESSLLERERLWFQEYEEQLHAAKNGPFWLEDERVAALVVEDLHHFDGDRYQLDSFCVMPNHVHAVLMPLPLTVREQELWLQGMPVTDRENRLGYLEKQTDGTRKFIEFSFRSLASIMHSVKRHTARESNRVLKRSGTFWQAESYDHYIRSEEERARTIRYVLNNPVKAKLVDDRQKWRWSWCRSEAPETGGTGS